MELGPRVVELRGEYDAGNTGELWNELVRVIEVDEADLVLDLGEVTFMDASTITVFIKAKSALDQHNRSFSLRSLSTSADRIIGICGLECLAEGFVRPRRSGAAGAAAHRVGLTGSSPT